MNLCARGLSIEDALVTVKQKRDVRPNVGFLQQLILELLKTILKEEYLYLILFKIANNIMGK